MCMNTLTEPKRTRRAIVQGISFRPDQMAFIESEAESQLHGNRSRIVQEAVDLYRQVRNGRVVVMPSHRTNDKESA